ncbi:response regulator [Phormidium tenue FACHB-886]|nr:response regulator [Phormidium tenue FACHB-886]
MKILLVEDDEQLVDLLKSRLAPQQYVIDVATDGQIGWDLVQSVAYDLVVLDVMLPQLDGISFCRQLRAKGNQVPVLLFTAKADCDDRISGLDAGADDYLIKSAPLPELEARIRALLRRQRMVLSAVLKWGDLRLDLASCEASFAGLPLNLTVKEYALLELLMRNPQRVYSQSTILNQLWSIDEEIPGEDAVRTHIKRLRHKLKAIGAADLIETVYGIGYKLNPDPQLVDRLISPSPAPSSSDLWQQNQSKLLERITVLQQAAQNTGDQELLERAQRECHKLIGLLGMLGLPEGAAMVQQIKTLLQSASAISPSEQPLILAYVTALQQQIETVSAGSQTAQRLQKQRAASGSNGKILILDDDCFVLRLLQVMLKPQGFEVLTLSDPLQFWDQLEAVEPDLLILDLQLPGTSGIQLCQTLRNHSRWSWLPIVFLSAQEDAETVQQAFKAGADDFISKPVNAAELVMRLLNRLERSRSLQQKP